MDFCATPHIHARFTKRQNRYAANLLTGTNKTHIIAIALVVVVVAEVEVDNPRAVTTVGNRRGRPIIATDCVRKIRLVNTRIVTSLFDQAIQLFHVGQPPTIAYIGGSLQGVCPIVGGGCACATAAIPCLA